MRPKLTHSETVVIFSGNKMIMKDKKEDRAERSSFKLDQTKTPKTIDIGHSEDDKKDSRQGIYELDGDHFKICYNRDENGKRPTTFESKVGTGLMLGVLKRDKNAAPFPEEKEPNVAEFPTAIIGKWKFSSGETKFGIINDTEFTKDGRVLQLKSTTKEWEEYYKYRFDKAFLVLSPLDKPDVLQGERRIRIASISADELVATSPNGVLKRLK